MPCPFYLGFIHICQNDSDLEEGGNIRYRTFKISIGRVNGLANKGGKVPHYWE